jgi:hypothetical protein
MAKLAYCRTCRATYPLVVVQHDGGRSGKTKEPACPMGHGEIEQLESLPKRPRAKKQ